MSNIALIHGNVIPMDGRKRYSAVLAMDGKITAVGNDQEICQLASDKGLEIIDLQGATVLPGFHDCHVHLSLTGYDAQGVNMYDAGNIPEIIRRFQEVDAIWESDRWLYGQRLDEGLLEEKRPPLMKELDVFDRPVFISDRGGHYVIVNRLAFAALGIDEDVSGVRKDENGNLTGRLQDDANKMARQRFPWTRQQTLDAMRYTGEEALKKGITTIHCMESFTREDPCVPILVEDLEEFPVDLVIYWCTMPDPEEELCKKTGILGGDIYLDGSIGSRTAAFEEKYEDGDGCGYLNYPYEQVVQFVEDGVTRDLGMSFHAIGEKGIWQALDAYEEVMERHPEKKDTAKLRLEHFGWPGEEGIRRAAALGVRISTQPGFTYLRGGPDSIYRTRLGIDREKAGYPLRLMLDAGLCLGGGSDSDITPLDSLLGIHAAVNQPYPENAVTPYEAVRMYTSDGARCGWEEEWKGQLIPGMQADMVILKEDPMTVNPATIKDIAVLGTIRKGKLVYNNGLVK